MRPGRPREFDTERALDDAMDLFWRKGYRETTTRDLEATLGITQSSIYQAFGSKAALADAVLGRYQSLLDRDLLDPLIEREDGLAAIDDFFVTLGEWLTEGDGRGCLMGRFMGEAPRPDADVEARLAGYRARLRVAMSAALGRAAAAGEIPADTVDSRTGVLVGMELGVNLAVLGADEREGQRAMREGQRAMVRGVRAEMARWGEAAAA